MDRRTQARERMNEYDQLAEREELPRFDSRTLDAIFEAVDQQEPHSQTLAAWQAYKVGFMTGARWQKKKLRGE